MRTSKRIILAGVAGLLALSVVAAPSANAAMKEGNRIAVGCCR
jgi:hypothetical protein